MKPAGPVPALLGPRMNGFALPLSQVDGQLSAYCPLLARCPAGCRALAADWCAGRRCR